MSEIVATTEAEFDDAVESAPGPVVAVFTAPSWCVPCRRFEPHWNKAQEQEALAEYTFVKVDMGEDPQDTAQHWATARFDVLGVPTVKRFAGGEVTDVSARTVPLLIKELNQ